MLAQFVQDLVHLERGEDGFDQDCRLDRPARHAQLLLRGDENVVPQPRFEVAFELGQIEVGAAAARDQFLRVVEEVQAEIEDAAGDRLAVDVTCFSGRCQPRGRTNSVAVLSPSLYCLPSGLTKSILRAHRVAQVQVSLDVVVPFGRVGVLEVRHEDAGAGIERVDDHLAVDGPGDFDAPILDVGQNAGAGPASLADRCASRAGIPVIFRRRIPVAVPRAAPAVRARRAPYCAVSAANTTASGVRISAYSGVMRPLISIRGRRLGRSLTILSEARRVETRSMLRCTNDIKTRARQGQIALELRLPPFAGAARQFLQRDVPRQRDARPFPG